MAVATPSRSWWATLVREEDVARKARALFVLLALALSACGAPSAPSVAPQVAGAVHHPARVEAHLFGLTEDAFPELAPLWPALSAQAATEITEQLLIDGAQGTHCLEIVVAGDLARAAAEGWREGARDAGYDCAPDARRLACRREPVALSVGADAGRGREGARLEALASEIGVDPEPSSTLSACVAVSPPRLASMDARLHRVGLLEPWRELHERLGARRLTVLRWTRSERGDEVTVRYRGDEEAFELAVLWARQNGLAEAEGAWQRLGPPLGFSLALREGPPPQIELTLERAP